MPEKDSNSGDTVEFEIETNPADGKLIAKGKLPARLLRSLGNGLNNAIQHGFAGFSPGFFRKARAGVLRSQITQALTDDICKNIDDPQNREFASNLLLNDFVNQADKTERRAKIIEGTANELEHISNDPDFSEPPETIGDDFLFHFWEMADKISQEGMREIFAKILANEIASPGTFSAATLNLLTTLHPNLARKFDDFCKMTFEFDGLEFVITSMPCAEAPATKHNSISSTNIIGEFFIDFGLTREDVYDLHSCGLIRSTGEEEYPDLTNFFASENVTFAGRRVRFEEKEYVPRKPGFSIYRGVSVISLSPVGSEIRRVISLEPHAAYLEKLKDVMRIANVEMKI